MKIRSFLSFVLLFAGISIVYSQEKLTPADLADPTVNTAVCRFDYFASAAAPMGMVALNPDTKHIANNNGLWESGYHWDDEYIFDFSHVHNAQTAGVPVMPVTGVCRGNLGLEANKSRFSHEKETVKTGYHKVFLEDYGITAELTATCRVGMHRYTFPATEEAHLLFDLGATLGPTTMDYAYARQVSPTEIEGYSIETPTHRRKKQAAVYFVARVDKPVDGFGGWMDGEFVQPANGVVCGKGSGVYLTYRNMNQGATVLLKVGISNVSMENARMNLDAEVPHWDFDRVVKETRDEWNAYLGHITVEGGTHAQQVKFYTDLMHVAVGRRIANDVDGSYSDCTGVFPIVRKIPLRNGKPEHAFIEADGLWGTHWNLNILWALVYPEYGNWMAETFLDYYRNAGTMSRCSWGGNYTYVMVGDHATPLLATLMSTGRATFDPDLAYAGAYKNAFTGGIRDRAGYEAGPNPQGGGMDWYLKYGYVPVEIKDRGEGYHRGGTSMTLEYAYQDWCIAQMAKQLNRSADVPLFEKRAENWRNVFDPVTGWARPRLLSGDWYEPFTPVTEGADFNAPGFIEGSSASYTFYVPQNIEGLIAAMGGKKKFAERLESNFIKAEPYRFITPHGQHGKGWVDYENQPSCEMAHLFNYAGMPWKTQYWVNKVKEVTFGGTDPYSGYNGDEDQGQMGALGVLMAVGLFSVDGLVGDNPTLEITTPLFDRVVMTFPSVESPDVQRTFEIVAKHNKPSDIYIQSARLNGKPLNSFRFPLKEFFNGGTLELTLGSKPNKKWGIEEPKSFHDFTVQTIDGKDFPLSKLKGKKVLAVNVASKCGLTPQYKQLQALYERYGGDKFVIVGFPANNFAGQEPGTNAEIQEFCTLNYGVTFPMMSKISVKGDDIAPVYQWLTRRSQNGKQDADVTWNFQKFLIDEQGNWVATFPPATLPNDERIVQWIEGKGVNTKNISYRFITGSYTGGKEGEGVSVYEYDATTGYSQAIEGVNDVINTSFLAFSPDSEFVYAAGENGDASLVYAMKFDRATGSMHVINKVKAGGADPCYLSVTEKHVITANYSGGSISVFGRKADGSLTEALQVVRHTGSSINADRQGAAHVHQAIFTPDGKYLIVNDLGTDYTTVYRYNPDGTAQVLTAIDSIQSNLGGGPRHLCFHPHPEAVTGADATRAYIIYILHELDGKISTVAIDREGRLKPLYSTTVAIRENIRTGAADIHITSDGRFLYATNRGTANDITCFAISDKGEPEFVQQVATGGNGPRNFALTPDERFIFVAHQQSGIATVFSRNPQTGKLTNTGKTVCAPQAVCLLFY